MAVSPVIWSAATRRRFGRRFRFLLLISILASLPSAKAATSRRTPKAVKRGKRFHQLTSNDFILDDGHQRDADYTRTKPTPQPV